MQIAFFMIEFNLLDLFMSVFGEEQVRIVDVVYQDQSAAKVIRH